jgi:hypothetical protein
VATFLGIDSSEATISFDRSRYLDHVTAEAAHRLVDDCRTVGDARGVALELLKERQ